MQPSPLSPSGKGGILVADSDLEKYCALAIEAGATHAKQIHPSSVVTAPWVRLKCQFGCPGYGKGHCCPPHTPTSDETRAILDCYQKSDSVSHRSPARGGKRKGLSRSIWTRWSNWKARCSRITTIRLFFFWRDLAGNARNVEPSRENLVLLRGKPDPPWKVAGLTYIRRPATMTFLFKPFGKGPKRIIGTV